MSRNDEIRKELTTIAQGKAGLTPKTVLQVAKNPRSTLHQYFCWDDSEAARRFREAQAYELIRRVKVTLQMPDNKTLTIRAFFPLKHVGRDGTIDHSKPGSYLPMMDAIQDEDALAQIIASAKSELRAFTTKYRQLESVAEFSGVFEIVSEMK